MGRLQLFHEGIEAIGGKVSTGQACAGGPGRLALAKCRLHPIHDGFGQPAIGGYLAAENVEQHTVSRIAVLPDDVVAGCFVRPRSAIVKQRTHTGVAPYNIVLGDWPGKVFTGCSTQIAHLARRDFRFAHGAVMVGVRGADQRVVRLVGNGEDDPAIAILEDVAPAVIEQLANHDVTASHQPDVVCIIVAEDLLQDFVYPGPGRVDDQACGQAGAHAACSVLHLDVPVAALSPRRHDPGARPDIRPAICRIAGIEDDKPGILHPAVGIFERPREQRLERFAGTITLEVKRPGGRQKPAPAQVIVEQQPQPQQPGRPQAAMMRQDEPQWPDDVRCHLPQHFALLEGFAHQPELVMLQVPQAAMHQLGRGR
jgi:hypothetical protein